MTVITPFRAACIAAAICALFGCGQSERARRDAYAEAVAAVEREKSTVENMQREYDCLKGEFFLHDFEGRIRSGDFTPRLMVGFSLGEDSFGRPTTATWLLYRALPKPWYLHFEQFLTDEVQSLPWYDLTRGEAYRRKAYERYRRLLSELQRRLELERDKLRRAEEYAQLLKPSAATR